MSETRSHVPNALLTEARLCRESPSGSGRRMSRQELAEAVNAHQWRTHRVEDRMDENDIGKLERGEHRWPRAARREALRAVLGASTDAELGFYIIRRPSRPPESFTLTDDTQADDTQADDTQADDTQADDTQASGAGSWSGRYLAALFGSGLGTAFDDDERAGKAALLASVRLLTDLDGGQERTGPLGPPDVERIRQHVTLFELVVWRIGGAELRHWVANYITGLDRLMRSRACGSPVKIQLDRILAELHRMVGWMYLHAEDHAAACRHWEAGALAADRGHDGMLLARILDGRSQQLCQLGRHDEALATTRLAKSIAEGIAPSATAAMLTGRTEAWIYAEKGLRAEALAAIRQARTAVDAIGSSVDAPWMQWFDEAQMDSAEGHCTLILAQRGYGDGRRAAQLIRTSIQTMPDRFDHSRMLNLSGLAGALVAAGDLDEAAATFEQGVTQARQAGSAEMTARLHRDFRRYATPHVGHHHGLQEASQNLAGLVAGSNATTQPGISIAKHHHPR